ncbi:hypothetical protein HK100_001897 [Physocladia obscura]|uniref:Uncharacterized protein n=1 Tax=Physocladia obscura TaxID=109957 RepID=A0AAD5SW80_9FUNG|nr:hypothetical protein HK100_001897 [Physocladia obscura]
MIGFQTDPLGIPIDEFHFAQLTWMNETSAPGNFTVRRSATEVSSQQTTLRLETGVLGQNAQRSQNQSPSGATQPGV